MTFTPNKSRRIAVARIRWIVMHADASPSEKGTRGWVFNPDSQVSYHKYITRAGVVETWVPDEYSAWACGPPGKSAWSGVNGINSWTLSVAFANKQDGKEHLTPAQLAAAARVIMDWRTAHPDIEGIITHKMSATPHLRKHDPEAAPNFRIGDFT